MDWRRGEDKGAGLYINSEVVIPAKAGIQRRNTGFPRIKYGAGSVKPGMTNKGKRLLTHHIRWT
jgi:hypothetical protein